MSAPPISKRAELLAKLWADGISSSEIAGKLGGGITAAGIDVEAKRIGLPARRAVWDSKTARIRFKIDGDAPKPETQGEIEMPERPAAKWTPPPREPAPDTSVLNLGVDTSTPTGRMVHNTLMNVAQFEREMMLERQREGIAKAKREGKYMGRKPTAREKADEVKALAAEGLGAVEIAKRLEIGRVSVWRILNGAPETEAKMQERVEAWKKRERKERSASA